MTSATILIIGSTFALAGLVKGTIGLGLPTVAIGLLGLVMAPAEAAALLVVPSVVTNAWQLASGGPVRGLLRRLWPLLLGIAVGTACAAGSLSASHTTRIAMGASLALYGLFGLARIPLRVPRRLEAALSLPIGLANGAITAATGTFVLPAVPYIQALDLPREQLIQALGLSFTVSTLALAAALAHSGAFNTSNLGASAIALVPALIGMQAGTWLRPRIDPGTFRMLFFAGCVALGVHLAL